MSFSGGGLGDVCPWDLRVALAEISGYLPPGFADDLNEMNQREAKIFVFQAVARISSSIVVSPSSAFSSPSWNIVRMP